MDAAPPPLALAQKTAPETKPQQPHPPQLDFGTPLIDARFNPSRFPFEMSEDEFATAGAENQAYLRVLEATFSYFKYYPHINMNTNILSIVNKLNEIDYKDDFLLSACWHPHFIVALFYYGFLPIAEGYPHTSPTHEYKHVWLLPKLHKKRCVIDWKKYHIPHNIPRQSEHMYFSMNADFNAVVAGCIRQHSDAWLYPRYRAVLNEIHQSNDNRWFVRLHSFEVWMKKTDIMQLKRFKHLLDEQTSPGNGDHGGKVEFEEEEKRRAEKLALRQKLANDQGFQLETPSEDCPINIPSLSTKFGEEYYLVAGELGFTVNNTVYCSMTGFRNSNIDNCGSVQLHTLAAMLRNAGIEVWDLGMGMPYKKAMGGVDIPRKKFTTYLEKQRTVVEQQFINDVAKLRENESDEGNRNENDQLLLQPPQTLTAAPLYAPKFPCSLETSYMTQTLKNKAKIDEENTKHELVTKTRREKKLRWLIKKHGEDSDIVKEYKEFIVTGKLASKSGDNEAHPIKTPESTSQPTSQLDPLLLCNLIPCRTLLTLESNIKDPKWVDLKPSAATLAKRKAEAEAALKASAETK